jgi:cell division protein FtsB
LNDQDLDLQYLKEEIDKLKEEVAKLKDDVERQSYHKIPDRY